MTEIFQDWKENIYDLFLTYYNNPSMSKLKNINDCSVYICRIKCLLLNEYRYLICVIDKDDLKIGDIKSLLNLKWKSFQTRTLKDPFNENICIHTYDIKRNYPYNLEIIKVKNDVDYDMYDCIKYRMKISLLKTDKKKSFNDKGTIVSALETYNTIITID